MKQDLLGLIGLLCLFGTAAGLAGEREQPPPDQLELRCSPAIGLSGYTAQIFLRIERPVRLYCPEVEVRWPNGDLLSRRAADCDPLEDGEEAPPWSGAELWPDGLRFRVGEGVWDIEVVVRGQSKAIRRSCRVEGRG